MALIHLAIDLIFVTGLMFLGSWLEKIGTITDTVDKFFTPLPLGVFGLWIIAIERAYE